jgi:TPR repeat protein
MRPFALVIVMALVGTAAADPCKDPLACEKACSAHDARACNVAVEGLFYGKHGAPFDPKRSFPLAKTACDAGDAFGCALLGLHYQDGSGTSWSAASAIAAYDKACRGGAGVACYNLAGMYGGGHGVVVDHAKFDAYTEKARLAWNASCDGGDTRWCTNAGYLIEDKDPAEAEVRYRRGCDHDEPVACVQVARVGLQNGKLKPSAFLAELDRICTGGEVTACGVLASFLDQGANGVAKDAKRAFEVAKKACDMNDASSCELVGAAYARADVVARDYQATDRYLRLACERRRAEACRLLASAHHTDADGAVFAQRGCEMNDAEACDQMALLRKGKSDEVMWLREACERGRGAACGTLIDRGVDLPVPPDIKKKLYKDACDRGVGAACERAK